ncbi:ABC transporter substrate-binding protein [Chlorobium phaeovibrioides]|uniref:ABC transporter substrate-binding protein n=1 Tax=Chlorobium phaeovibrioides TaxID=1094 RepID=A0A432AW86_CHLPH|nr:ABC transporter substrate-binding protein [Chlorobium phaeovibrioides]RTY38907.1 ABC transporter substrate-binding protein [Chlorobium phaeovibrioides]
MKRQLTLIALIFALCSTLSACRQNNGEFRSNTIITAVSADFDYLNPLLIQLSLSREVCTLIYPSLVKPTYDEKTGNIAFSPSAATSWEFSPDGKNVSFHLKKGIRWEDGTPLSSHDFKYSYSLYANPATASSRQDYLNDLLLKENGTPDIQRAVETPDSLTLVLHFNRALSASIVLDHFNDLMPVAKHVMEQFKPEEIRSRATEIPIVGAGPFKVSQWARQDKLVLETSPTSTLPYPAKTRSLIFVVVPEYTTRLAMLKSGQIDALISAGGINPIDTRELAQNSPDIQIRPVKDRYFDSIVWLNIDGEKWRSEKKVVPNPLFGDPAVRRAMTLAIDRQSIIDGFMGPEHATIVNTSLSPAYRSIANTSLDPYNYNPQKATTLLARAGWTPGADGILQKNGERFSFELAAPVGNPRRNYAATIIQQNLRQIGIDCRLRFEENLVFLKNQNEFRYEAALSGLAAETLPFQLIIWGSDFQNRTFNSSAFQNAELDSIIGKLSGPLAEKDALRLWQSYQRILHDRQPRTFLYYYDELEGFSRRVENTDINLLATLYNAYDWTLRKEP